VSRYEAFCYGFLAGTLTIGGFAILVNLDVIG